MNALWSVMLLLERMYAISGTVFGLGSLGLLHHAWICLPARGWTRDARRREGRRDRLAQRKQQRGKQAGRDKGCC
jgi:hypothetical protein